MDQSSGSEPLPAPTDLPARYPQASDPAGTGGAVAPAGAGATVPPSPPRALPDPCAASGPPWPRLVATDGSYTPPRLIRWPIVAGILLLAVWTAAALGATAISLPSSTVASSSSQPVAYTLTASDADFTATFPAKPQRSARSLQTITIISYVAQVSSHAIGVTYISLPASASFSLSGGINGMVASLPAGKVTSRSILTYQGQPAEDATISFSAGSAHVRVVRFGSSAYVLEGVGSTPASFAQDYKVLLDTFTPIHG